MTLAQAPIPSQQHAAAAAAAGTTTRATSPARGLRRVLIASINRLEGDTGVHTHTRMLADGLRAAGVACEIVSAFTASRAWLAVFAVRPLLLQRINKTWATDWHRRWHAAALRQALRRSLKASAPDVIIAQCPVSARAALDVRAELDLPSVRVALVCHFNHSEAAEYRAKGELAGDDNYRAMLAFEDRVLEEVDQQIYVSTWARQTVQEARALKAKSSAVIWNGVSESDAPSSTTATTTTATPTSRTTTTAPARAHLGLSDDDLVLMNVGSLEPRKNQLGLLALFATLHAQYPCAKLVLVGDGPARGDVEQKIADLNLADAVKLLGHRRDVPALLPLADLYIHYAALENCPLVLIEASRAGLPFAAVPAGGVPELQAALDCKYDLEPHDARASIDRLRPLLDHRPLRKIAGARARQRFESTFTRDAMTRAYLEALGSAAAAT